MSQAYMESYAASRADANGFWLKAAEAIVWQVKPQAGWRDGEGWFADGVMNTCHNAVDRHVEAGRGDDIALIYESPVTDTRTTFTFAQLRDHVARTAGMIAAQGVGKGDRVIIYMPMIPQALFAMLACARIGAIHSVVFGGFAAPELAKRIDDATPQLLLTTSCGIEGGKVIPYKPLVDHALQLAQHKVSGVILLQRPQATAPMQDGRDIDWAGALAQAEPADCVPVKATDPLYILYTSGTTGMPKGVVRQNGGHAVVLAWSMANIYGIQPGEVFWAASDVGWVVGHSYIAYGPLIAGATTLLFEGKPVGTPDAGTFWRTIARNDVRIFFTAPTAIRAVRKEDPDGRFIADIGTGNLRAMFLAGERADPDTIHWAEEHLKLPVIDHWWQTELGWPALATCLGLGDTRRKAGSAGFPVPGFAFRIVDDGGEDVPAGETGKVVMTMPLAPGCYAGLWNNEAGYAKAFATFPGHYETGDAGHIDADGFVNIMGRTDDIINVAGHRLSTGQMEQIVASHPAIAECAVIGVDDALKGMIPMAFAVAKVGQWDNAALEREIVKMVRDELGPVAALKEVHVVGALPKTRSGKILRAALRKVAAGEKIAMPPTIESPAALEAIMALFDQAPA
ncbi:propionyl-CoA synthetase [Sphingobium fontiphilum]|uniref:Propionyl-CoA synthetase n=1 Tax=Sphingobium fontiphilum TaxID=944425 RepID=A0A7W6DDY5_9SPHN|nr:AMP-binding protein [Sphingobium fontiphilum]MBB3981501.1 propionyl-CoA synthetase [Sphingobium fontiphilum]